MSSIDHEYNNFLLIQFLLSNIMILVLSILTIYHCILSHFMIETVRILSLFNIFPDSMYFFSLLARAFGIAVGCNWRSIFLHFSWLFGFFFERRLLNGNFNFAVTFSCQSFLFLTLFRVTLASLGNFSPFNLSRRFPLFIFYVGVRGLPPIIQLLLM